MVEQSHTPPSITIKPRNRKHDIAEGLSRDWFDNDPFKTAWLNSLSITFPVGEKFFIDSVRHFANEIEDPKLQKEIRNFCTQEGFHRREHNTYNQLLCKQRGYDLEYLEGRSKKKVNFVKKHYSMLRQLAVTVALEHFTAIMAELVLSENSIMSKADPAIRRLWEWHAAEEMEHKAVTFDVFRAVGGKEKMRKRTLHRASFLLKLELLMSTIHMLRRNRKMWSWRVWASGWKFLYSKDGIMHQIRPAYKEYFRNSFHPWQRNTQDFLESWKSRQAKAA